MVFFSGNTGTWEFKAQFLPAAIGYVRNSTIYQPLKNRYIDKHVRSLRGRAGVELFDRNEGFQKAIELLRGGGAIGILADQHAGDQGLWVPFFGILASTTSLPALLAKRTGAAVLGTAIYSESPGRWRMSLTDRIDAPGDSVEALTAKANDLIAAQTRRAPEDGFWLHNRWKTPRPNFLLARYKRGVYAPKNLTLKQLQPFRILIRSSGWLLNQIVREPRRPGPPEHHATRFLRIADDCGADVDLVGDAKQVLLETSHVQDQKLLGLCPGAKYGPAKRWLPERFAEAAVAVSAQSKVKWILFGVDNDESICETVASALGENCINRIGQTTLDQLIEELRRCRLLLTNDTGTMHLAALLGVPVVAVFGSTEPALTRPLGNGHIILRHHVECSPCFLRECPIDFRCMKAVSVQEVVDAVMSILQ